MHLPRSCCALALLSATVALPIKTYLDPYYPEGQLPPVEPHHSKDTHIATRSINKLTSEESNNHYNSEAQRLVPNFQNLPEKTQQKWSDFYDCHPTRWDGRFIKFSQDGICGDKETAVFGTNGEVDTEATNEAWREEHKSETLPQIKDIYSTDSSQHELARRRYQPEPLDGPSLPHTLSPESIIHDHDIPPAKLQGYGYSQKLRSRSEKEYDPKPESEIRLQKSDFDVHDTSDSAYPGGCAGDELCMAQDGNSYPGPDSSSDSSSDLDPGPTWSPDPMSFPIPDYNSNPSSDYSPNQIPDHAPSTWLHPPYNYLDDKTTPITDTSVS